jgi:hypothetical protein
MNIPIVQQADGNQSNDFLGNKINKKRIRKTNERSCY